MEMYQSPCHNSLEPITSIITIIQKNCAHIHVPVGTTEASEGLSATEEYTFGITFYQKIN